MSEHPKAKRVQVEVDVPLTEAMIEHRGMRLAQLGKTRRAMEQDMKDAASAARKELKKLKKEIATLEDEIGKASAKAMVDADEVMHFETNTVRTIRVDPEGYGVIVSERPMSAEERQQELDIDLDAEGGDKAAPVKAKRGRKAKDEATATH